MRLASVSASVALSAVLLSGCSFITGKPGSYQNPFAKQKAAQHGQYAYGAQAKASNRCQVYSPRQRAPQGCRPEQVTLAVGPQGPYGQAQGQHHSTNGFPQQPSYGQPQYAEYADGAYGTAVGQAGGQSSHYNTGPKIKKPKLRGSLSLGLEKSVSGSLIDYGIRTDLDPRLGYNPQDYNQVIVQGTPADGSVTTNTYTANELNALDIFAPNAFDRSENPTLSYDDAWSTPASLRAGVEYIAGKRTTIFANGGYTYAEGNSGDVSSVEATAYNLSESQSFVPETDAAGDPIPGSFVPDGPATTTTSFLENREIASFNYEFSDLKQYDLEVGARHYFNPLVKSEGFKTVTPFVGASVGASHVDAVNVTIRQEQARYSTLFGVASANSSDTITTTARLYDSQWVPQGQLNVGAEWQVTPGFALAAESGVRVQGAREYADFTNAAGDTISGEKGDANISIPFTLRGSVNF